MKTPFVITIIVVVLFIVLIVFSIFRGPISSEDSLVKEIRGVDPIIKMNRAISSGDISGCEGDKNCESIFIFTQAMKSKNSDDCNGIRNEKSRINCKDNVLFLKATSAAVVDKDLCDQIQDTKMRSMCKGE